MDWNSLYHRIHKEYFMSERGQYLDTLLQAMTDAGYVFHTVESFSDAIEREEALEPKLCVMRVDVDSDPRCCLIFARIFKRNGCTASFYFRLDTIDRSIMRELKKQGFCCSRKRVARLARTGLKSQG